MFKLNIKDTRTTPLAISIVNFEHVIAGWVLIYAKIMII